MKPDPLQTLMRLRQAELDTASRNVAEALDLEIAAEAARAAEDAAIARETDSALYSDADTDVERFARWLRHARARLRVREQALADAAAATAVRRAEHTLIRARAKTIEDALERREEAAQQARLVTEQHGYDETALRRHRQ